MAKHFNLTCTSAQLATKKYVIKIHMSISSSNSLYSKEVKLEPRSN